MESSDITYDQIVQFLQKEQVSEINHTEIVRLILQCLQERRVFSYEDLLTLLYRLHGKPFVLKNHFYMKSLFARVIPPQMTYKTARQIAKSQSNAVHSVTMCAATPHYNILHVTPLYEMIHKFSVNVVSPLIQESPLKSFFIHTKNREAVLQRSLKNGSNMIFTFAFNDCTRIRGNTAGMVKYDEYQNFDASFEPIINQVTSAVNSDLDLSDAEAVQNANSACIMRFGTPLTFENGLEQAWQESSQAEWAILCDHCGKLNIPSLKEDLDKMMGPMLRTEPVTPETPGLVCAKCGGYLFTRNGRWLHRIPERRNSHAGYHVPQCITPLYCENPKKWTELQQLRINRNKMSEAQFYNECCGESFDHGAKLISVTDLRTAAVLEPRTDHQTHMKNIIANRYIDWGLGVDWGGGGMSGISKTAVAVGGLRSDGIVEVFAGQRLHEPNAFDLEATRVKDVFLQYRAQFVAMDFHGSGNRLRYDRQLKTGLPFDKIYPISYTRVGNSDVVKHVFADRKEGIPEHFQANKTRSFLILSHLIQSLRVRFFKYDYVSRENPGLLNDFTALAEDRVELKQAGEVYTVVHAREIGPDDFANAVNYLVCGLFIRRGYWPDVGAVTTVADLTPEQQMRIDPKAWRDEGLGWFYE
jgi:hypothetical protein